MILVLGYGNITRSDDGVGIYVANRIDSKKIQNVEVMTCQQLQIEFVEIFTSFKKVYLIDASYGGSGHEIKKVKSGGFSTGGSSHALAPEQLLNLSEQLDRRTPEIYLCSVRGKNFDFGLELSSEAKVHADELCAKIIEKIQSAVEKV